VTKFRDKRTQWQGGQLSYFLHITQPSERREDLYCLTLVQTEALIAVIEHWRYLTRWLDDDPEIPLSQSTVFQFVNDIQRRLMMPCGSDNTIILSQYTPDGDYQESTDGGITYHDAPEHDPRNSVPLPPPFLPPGTVEAECTYADAIVNQFINSWINATGDGEELATIIAGILSFLAGLLGAAGAVVAVIVLAIAATVVQGTVAAWKAAFVSEVWDRFRCNLHDNQQTDGSFNAADVDAIYARLADEETGVVLISLQQMVAALGWQGLTIAARTGVGSPTADCACEGDCTSSQWNLGAWNGTTYVSPGTLIDSGTDFLEVQSVDRGDGEQWVYVTSDDDNICCDLVVEITEGTAVASSGWVVINCGTSRHYDNFAAAGLSPLSNKNAIGIGSSTVFTAKVSFNPP